VTLKKFFSVGWALPTKFSLFQLLMVDHIHPTWMMLEFTNGEFQKQYQSFDPDIYGVG
jgi:hypothetical protein